MLCQFWTYFGVLGAKLTPLGPLMAIWGVSLSSLGSTLLLIGPFLKKCDPPRAYLKDILTDFGLNLNKFGTKMFQTLCDS